MPVILPEQHHAAWLGETDDGNLKALLLPNTQEQGVQSAPLPARIIDKGLASDRVVIDTVVSKYADHVPLYIYREPKRPGSKTY
jgi:hypothetical protein